ncbi:MAG: ATP synthase F1 subunit epsilon [Erysipelotrichaceae bacterium]
MLHVRIITPEGLYREMDVDSIQAVSTEGQFGLLPNHMPFIASLATGKLSLIEQDVTHDYAVSGGVLHLLRNQVNILADVIESKNEINLERALEAKARAEAILKDIQDEHQRKNAEIALMRALNRINVKGE